VGRYLYDSLKLASQGRLSGYTHGPLLYEILAALEGGLYVLLRLAGAVSGPQEFVLHVVRHQDAHLVMCRSISALSALALVVVASRLGSTIGGPLAGGATALLCAANLTLVALASKCKEEPLYWAAFAGATAACRGLEKAHDGRRCIAVGLLIGAAIAAKYLGVFALVLGLCPLVWRGRPGLRSSFMILAAATVTTTILLLPALLDARAAFASVARMARSTSDTSGEIALPQYLLVDLPNLIGWWILVPAVLEVGYRLWRGPRASMALILGPALQLAFLGLRPGWHMAYYMFPLGLVLIPFAIAGIERVGLHMIRHDAWGRAAAICVVLLGLTDTAFLSGTLKHGLLLLAPDTESATHEFVERAIPPGEAVGITGGISGMNFWGPQLKPLEDPGPGNSLERARWSVAREGSGVGFRVTVFDGIEPRHEAIPADLAWLVVPDPAHSPEASMRGNGWVKVWRIEAFPKPYALEWPHLHPRNYEDLRRTSLGDMLRLRRRGMNQTVYRRYLAAPSALPTAEARSPS
jgi:hypothetical protein